jgi:hypothetical protein
MFVSFSAHTHTHKHTQYITHTNMIDYAEFCYFSSGKIG